MAEFEAIGIRHWVAESNVDIEGGTVGSDRPLVKDEIWKMRETATYVLGRFTFHVLWHSPLVRTTETAEIIVDTAQRLPAQRQIELRTDDRLVEIKKGDWTGMPVPEVIKVEGDIDQIDKPFLRPPNGENDLDVAARGTDFITERRRTGDDRVVFVSHNNTILTSFGALLGDPVAAWKERPLDNGALAVVRANTNGWQIDEALWNKRPYEDVKS